MYVIVCLLPLFLCGSRLSVSGATRDKAQF